MAQGRFGRRFHSISAAARRRAGTSSSGCIYELTAPPEKAAPRLGPGGCIRGDHMSTLQPDWEVLEAIRRHAKAYERRDETY